MADPEEIVRWAVGRFQGKLALTTSFQKGGMIVLDMAMRTMPSLRVLTLDTGRLPEETFTMMERVRQRYGVAVETIAPDPAETGRMVALHGPNLFYRDQPSRMLCCQVRKVRPLEERLRSFSAVLTGLRRDQSDARESIEQIDDSGMPLKVNPLTFWTQAEVDEYTRAHDLPVHPLYERGYTSIGCAPCTRATEQGENARAGRWWWEEESAKECGIHFSPEGVARRTVDVMLDEILRNA